MRLPLPLGARELTDEYRERLSRVPTQLNEYGYDSFGMDPSWIKNFGALSVLMYRYYFRCETQGIEKVPEGPVLLIGNHAGNTLPMDGGLLFLAMILEAEPPRIPRAMAEFYLPNIPWWNEMIHRSGAVVGTPENCKRLLKSGECIMVFPEGSRGFIKPYSKAYQLQEFGRGFARLALETDTPIVPVGIVGSEEQSPGLLDSKRLAAMIGAPAFPVTWTFPLLGVLGFLPFPVKYQLSFGEPMRLRGSASDEDAVLQQEVDQVKDQISLLIEEGLERRNGWFS